MIYKTAKKREEIKDLEYIYKKVKNEQTKREIKADISRLKNGFEAERANGKVLDKYFGTSNKNLLIHDIRITAGGKSSQIDHILITPYEIFVLESKSSKKKVLIAKDGKLSTQASENSKEYPLGNPVLQNKYHAKVLMLFLVKNGRPEIQDSNLVPIVLLHAKTETKEKKLPFPYVRPKSFGRKVRRVWLWRTLSLLIPFFPRKKKLYTKKEIRELGKLLVKEDSPARYDYFRKYGVKKRKNWLRFLLPRFLRPEEPKYVFFSTS